MGISLGELFRTMRASAMRDERLGFRRGLRALFGGILYLLVHPRALVLCLAPWAINLLVIFPAILALGWWLVVRPVLNWLPDENAFLGNWIQAGAMFGLVPMLVFFSLAVALLVGAVIGAPFHDALGKRIEQDMLRHRPDLLVEDKSTIWQNAPRSIRESAKRLGFFLPRLMLLMLLGLIPIIGPVLALAANLAFTASFLAMDAFSQPMNRRKVPFEAKLGWTLANLRFAIGFGLPMLVVPCAFFLMPPLATAAGTCIYCQLALEGGRLPAQGQKPKAELIPKPTQPPKTK